MVTVLKKYTVLVTCAYCPRLFKVPLPLTSLGSFYSIRNKMAVNFDMVMFVLEHITVHVYIRVYIYFTFLSTRL